MGDRLTATERKEQILVHMQTLQQEARDQSEFTAAEVARHAGISTVLLYRLAGAEYKALRSELSGPRRSPNETVQALRQENAELQSQLSAVQVQLRARAIEEVNEAIRLIERLEEENLHLRSEIKLLQKRLEEGGHAYVAVPQRGREGLSIIKKQQQAERAEQD